MRNRLQELTQFFSLLALLLLQPDLFCIRHHHIHEFIKALSEGESNINL